MQREPRIKEIGQESGPGQNPGLNSSDALLSRYQYNKRKLKISLEKNIITRARFSAISTYIDKKFKLNEQPELENLLGEDKDSLLIKDFIPVLNKELFRYNQIIIKLSQQFAKNTAIQQLKLQHKDKHFIQERVTSQSRAFSAIMKQLTNDYLEGQQKNIDDMLIESGFIQSSQLEFLHNSALHLELKVQDRKFGEIAVKNEFTTEEIVQKALDEQTEIYKKTSKNNIIGDILVKRRHITPEVRDEILIIQNRVLEEDWEETLKNAGRSSIEEKEKNALFGALVIKEKLLDEKKVIEALRMQAREEAEYRKKKKEMPGAGNGDNKGDAGNGKETAGNEKEAAGNAPVQEKKPRWIGDILVENFGLSDNDRKRIVKKQMEYRIERINLKLGLNISNAHIELFNEINQYFLITYSKSNLKAHIKLLMPLPPTMTKENIIIWLYHKKISYGRIPGVVEDLIAHRIKPGDQVLLAKGDPPVPARVTPEFHFDIDKHGNKNSSGGKNRNIPTRHIPLIVKKGSKLLTLHTQKGKSGLNVNRCLVAASLATPQTVIMGQNIIQKRHGIFISACDGTPVLSKKNILSVNPEISINGDVTKDDSPLVFDCDFHVKGTLRQGSSIECRNLRASRIEGRAKTTQSMTILNTIINGEGYSCGPMEISSVENSNVTCEKNIVIHLQGEDGSREKFNRIYDSVITSDDILRINDAKIVASVVRARNRLILKKVIVGEKCKFIVGDSLVSIAMKTKIEFTNKEMKKIDGKIKILQTNTRELFDKIEKKDIAAIDEEIKTRTKNRRTKADIDEIAKLRLLKRQKEKEYEANIDEYGTIFMQNSNQIKAMKEERERLEREKNETEQKIIALYKTESETPELDVRRTMLPAGTVIQFRYNQEILSSDCEGFVFRETLNPDTHTYEIKRHRW
ncbi:MAG: hypothetical protein HQK66_11450 [Desulfamplus sp.]|nr:hypothetical protein [Desulfamplus sp.]